MPSVFLLALLLGVPWPGCIQAAQAQERAAPADPETRYTFVLVGVPLMDALGILIDETPISLVYETALVEGRTTFCRAHQRLQEEVLACILEGTGLDYTRLSSGTYLLFADPRTAPRYGRLAGQVVDADTGEPLAHASILLAGEDTGTATNQAGHFAFAALKPGPHRLVVTHVAYHDQTDTVWVAPEADNRVAVTMTARTVMTTPIIINGFTSRLPSEALGLGRRAADELAQAPTPGTVVQDIDAIVGVRAGDALSDVHVQSGAAGEHQYRLDGATVFVPIRNGGFFGPFSPFAVQQITVQKAGFGAEHGSHLSGVIEVTHRTAPAARRELVVQADPLSLNGRLSGTVTRPQERLEAAWMVAGRTALWSAYQPNALEDRFQSWSTPDLFLVDALRAPESLPTEPADAFGQQAPVEVGFNDVHAAVRVRLRELHSVHASLYRGRNLFGHSNSERVVLPGRAEIDDEYTWANTTTQFRYEGAVSNRAFASVGLWMSSYGFSHPFGRSPFATIDPQRPDSSSSEDFNDITERGLRAGWNYAATTRHFLSGNLEVIHTGSEFALSLDPLGTGPPIDHRLRRPARWRVSAFMDDQVALNHRMTLTPGLRLTYLPSLSTVYAEPRLAFRYDHPEGRRGAWAFRAAAGLYRQFINQFDVATYSTTALVPSIRFWLPVGTDGSPPRAYHLTGAFLYRPDAVWQFSVETFYKHQPHLLVLNYGAQATGGIAADDLLTGAEGYAYGVAFAASRTRRTTRFAAQYEYAVARRRVANRLRGAFVAVPWSTPHRVLLSVDVVPLRHVTATLRWQGIAGRVWGFRQAYYDYLEPNPATQVFAPYDLSDPEAHRLPFFSQWDVGVAYSRTVAGLGLQARLNLINVLNRHNVRDWNLLYDAGRAAYVRVARRSTPFIPSLSLRVRW